MINIDMVFMLNVLKNFYSNIISNSSFIYAISLKGYATPKSKWCFCLHFRPKDDVVMVQGKSLFGSKMLRCLYVSGETPLKWGVTLETFGGWHPETCKERSILDSGSDFLCTRFETTSSLGLKCKQKQDLLFGGCVSL